jgi:beta-lactamase class D
MRRSSSLLFGIVLSACGSAAPSVVTPRGAGDSNNERAAPSKATAVQRPSNQAINELPDAAQELEKAHVTGTIALFDSQDGSLGCSDAKLCQEAVVPASTFKIPHSMIAFETGVVEGPDTVLPWDGKEYWVKNWNQDLKFRDAFRYSCLPCYQAIARKVGEAKEREWVSKLAYGNGDVSGGVDKFWIWGGLRISALEQIDFLRRFDGDKLPISARTADWVRDIMTLDVTEKYVLRGKTGTTSPPSEARELAWFVGWLEQGERRVFFALLLTGHASDVDPMELRRPLTERILRARGLM